MTRSAVLLRDEASDAQEMLRSGLSDMPTDYRLHQSEEWRKLNGIEAPYRKEDDPIPAVWTVPHLQRRLIEAMGTMEKMQAPQGPKPPGGNWPKHAYDWGDRLGWEELPAWERRERDARQNFVKDRPTSQDIARMEKCTSWLVDLRQQSQELGMILTRWVICKCRDHSVKDMCREKGYALTSFYRQRDRACEMIVERLNCRVVPVF